MKFFLKITLVHQLNTVNFWTIFEGIQGLFSGENSGVKQAIVRKARGCSLRVFLGSLLGCLGALLGGPVSQNYYKKIRNTRFPQ